MLRLASRWLCLLGLMVTCLSMSAAAHGAQGPHARIRIMSTLGDAPFAAHVHGLTSDVDQPLDARYEWNFGDPGSPYNRLVGWNAAHVYREPGLYTITLKITDSHGHHSIATKHVRVDPDHRGRIYVSPTGNDANDGSSPGSAVRTIERARELLEDDTTILIQRGATYDLDSALHIEASNVHITADGSGPRPVLRWTNGSIPYSGIITMWWWARDIVIENLEFDSSQPLSQTSVRGTHPHGNNISVINCRFDTVSCAMNTEFGVNGFLAQDNEAGMIGAYFIWAIGRDHTYLGNHAGNSANEHTIRLGNASRVLIAHNDLRNTIKSTVWAMLGKWCYVANNTLRDGRVIVGPNFAQGWAGDRFRNFVAESNEVLDEGFVIYPGAEHLTLRNNVIRADGQDGISIWGWLGSMDRTVRDVNIYHNTIINEHAQNGCFLRLGDDAEDIRVINNLYVAPWLNTHNNSANVFCSDDDLASHIFRNNLWALSSTSNWVHFVAEDGVGQNQWNALGQTQSEAYRDFLGGDLTGDYMPHFNPKHGQPLGGVRFDYHDQPRPASGARSVGAVEKP
jgi:hypothetical protein